MLSLFAFFFLNAEDKLYNCNSSNNKKAFRGIKIWKVIQKSPAKGLPQSACKCQKMLKKHSSEN